MSFSVLIVDDSHFFRQRLKEIISECDQLNVIGFAENGREAIEKAQELKPDIITMDYEMPYLDGISAVREIMQLQSVPIVMFSSMTYEGARITLDALEAGAVDFIPKNFADVSNNSVGLKKKLHEKLILFAAKANPAKSSVIPAKSQSLPEVHNRRYNDLAARGEMITPSSSTFNNSLGASSSKNNIHDSPIGRESISSSNSIVNIRGKIKILIIGASTGGPVAVADIIVNLPVNFPVPVVVIQHMPSNFTKAFADRLNSNSALHVKEAENGDRVEQGQVLIAPGGKQLIFERGGSSIKIIDGDDRVNYKPCVDITFASASTTYHANVLGIVLTGMGSDGCEGARLLKQKGSYIWSQDKDSCVVYGMPAAVVNEKLSDAVFPIKEMTKQLINKI